MVVTLAVLLASVSLGGMLVVTLVNAIAAPRLRPVPPAASDPMVSLLIPARDEEENLRVTLPRMLASAHSHLEVLVLDDGSSDGTRDLVLRHAAADSRLRLLDGAPPPAGWSGKNRACHLLARAARGDTLIFCDADVSPAPSAVTATVRAMTERGWDVLTAIPRHRFGSWAERAVVPMVATLPIMSLLPLPLVPRSRAPSLAAGNGQWLAFRRDAYAAAGGHEAVRSAVVEDVALARLAKLHGLRVGVALAPEVLTVRMYRGAGEVWGGFRKNVYALGGGSAPSFVLVIGAFVLTMVLPLALALAGVSFVPLVLLAAVRVTAALALRQGAGSVLLHPVGAVLLPLVAFASWRASLRGTIAWKGRMLPPAGVAGRPGAGAGAIHSSRGSNG